MENPIHILLDDLLGLLKAIAPEKAADLDALLPNGQPTIDKIETEDSFAFFVYPSTNRITAGIGCCGRLWATGYGYFCIAERLFQAEKQDIHTAQEINLKGDRQIGEATTLIEWAIDVEIQIAELRKRKERIPGSFAWPDDLPKPVSNPPKMSNRQVADELFLCAAAFILHHELAHIRLGHVSSNDEDEMKAIEAEADMASAEWLLQGLDQHDERFVKRALGVALALAWMASLAVFVPEDQEYHPPSCDRLYNVVARFVTDPNHLVWAFVGAILRANLEGRQMKYDRERETTSFKDDVEYCISVIRKYQAT